MKIQKRNLSNQKSQIKGHARIFSDQCWLTISNFLTVSRIVLTPLVAYGIACKAWSTACILFFIASITDLLDGHFARLLEEKTQLGALLDPIADKLFLLSSFGAFVFYSPSIYNIPHWFFFLQFFREISIMIGSAIVLQNTNRYDIDPSFFGKANTTLHLMFVFWLFICNLTQWKSILCFEFFLAVVTISSLLSWFDYLLKGLFIIFVNTEK